MKYSFLLLAFLSIFSVESFAAREGSGGGGSVIVRRNRSMQQDLARHAQNEMQRRNPLARAHEERIEREQPRPPVQNAQPAAEPRQEPENKAMGEASDSLVASAPMSLQTSGVGLNAASRRTLRAHRQREEVDSYLTRLFNFFRQPVSIILQLAGFNNINALDVSRQLGLIDGRATLRFGSGPTDLAGIQEYYAGQPTERLLLVPFLRVSSDLDNSGLFRELHSTGMLRQMHFDGGSSWAIPFMLNGRGSNVFVYLDGGPLLERNSALEDNMNVIRNMLGHMIEQEAVLIIEISKALEQTNDENTQRVLRRWQNGSNLRLKILRSTRNFMNAKVRNSNQTALAIHPSLMQAYFLYQYLGLFLASSMFLNYRADDLLTILSQFPRVFEIQMSFETAVLRIDDAIFRPAQEAARILQRPLLNRYERIRPDIVNVETALAKQKSSASSAAHEVLDDEDEESNVIEIVTPASANDSPWGTKTPDNHKEKEVAAAAKKQPKTGTAASASQQALATTASAISTAAHHAHAQAASRTVGVLLDDAQRQLLFERLQRGNSRQTWLALVGEMANNRVIKRIDVVNLANYVAEIIINEFGFSVPAVQAWLGRVAKNAPKHHQPHDSSSGKLFPETEVKRARMAFIGANILPPGWSPQGVIDDRAWRVLCDKLKRLIDEQSKRLK